MKNESKLKLSIVINVILIVGVLFSAFKLWQVKHDIDFSNVGLQIEPLKSARTIKEINEEFALSKSPGKPIDSLLAAEYIALHKKNSINDTHQARHFWIDTSVLKFYYNLWINSNNQMDGIRIYLADYSKEIPNPIPGEPNFPVNTTTAILVGTLSMDSLDAKGNLKFKYHKDWMVHKALKQFATGDPDIYDYSDPCPPGKNCDAGATLGGN